MAKIAVLAMDEAVRIDARRLGQVMDELGESAATQVIGAALEQLALGLRRTISTARRGNLAQTVCDADRLSRLAWQMGLVTLAGVAVDVGACAERQDRPGLAATTARLGRIGNRSLTEIWDPPEAS